MWRYRGAVVVVAETADIPTPYRQGHAQAGIVQRALKSVEPWRRGAPPARGFTVDLCAVRLKRLVVRRDGLMPFWGKHAGHHARHVQISPFVKVVRPQWTTLFTVELTGSPESPRLVRAYPGEYQPPLPWQGSAEGAPGGVEECVEFWRQHAYVYTDSIMVPGSNIGLRAPSWFMSQ